MRATTRRAFICKSEKCQPPVRIFLRSDEPDSVPRCPEHGASMVPQSNNGYLTGKRNGLPQSRA